MMRIFFFNRILMVVIKPPIIIIQRPDGTRTAQDVGMLPTCCMSCVVLCEFIELCELLPVPSVCLMVLILSSTIFKSCTLLLLYLVLTDLMASPSATTFPTLPDMMQAICTFGDTSVLWQSGPFDPPKPFLHFQYCQSI